MATFYGYLHSWDFGGTKPGFDIAQQNHIISNALNNRKDFTTYSGKSLPPFRGWETYRFFSPRALMGEEIDLIKGPYAYPFYIYRNTFTGNILIGSWRYNITNHIVQALNQTIDTNLVRISINVQKITVQLTKEKEKGFFASNLQIDVNSFGSHLDTVSLSGADVIGSGFLKIFKPNDYTARQIGLRVSESGSESVRLQSNGGIQIYSDGLRALEVCLGFVNDADGFLRNI